MINTEKTKKGALVLIGGAEDRREDKCVLKKILEINNASKVVIIPSATLYPLECAEDYFHAFRDLGVKNIEVFDIREKWEADKTDYFDKLDKANLVFFTGGDQVRLTDILLQTRLLDKIKYLFLNKGLTVAGTSAGASAAANPMTYDGDDNGLIKGSVRYGEGFGFLENITIDTHFVARGRLGRLTQFLCNGFTSKGIGIGENTSITIKPDNTFEVTGSGIVTTISTENIKFTNFDTISEGDKISIDGIQLGFLQEGALFDLSKWQTIDYIPTSSKTQIAGQG